MIRRLVVRVAVAAAILAAAAAAIAVPGGVQRSPQPVLARTTAPLAHSNSSDGRAILTATNLAPGERRTGQVTITNEGHRGALYLVANGPRDTPGASGLRLSERLRMTIVDGSLRVLADGPLSTLTSCHPLGEFAAGESRTYNFTVELPDAAGNAYAGAGASVDYEWLETAVARDACPGQSEDVVDLPDPPAAPAAAPAPAADQPAHADEPKSAAVVAGGQVTVTLGDMQIAIVPGPYKFSGRTGTATVGIRCIRSDTGTCKGRLELERWKGGQGKGIAMAVGDFTVKAGRRKQVTLKLNARAKRRITSTGLIAVRAYVTAKDASGRRHRVAYKDRLRYRR